MATAAATRTTTFERVGRWVETDPILTGLRDGALRVGLPLFQPSGVDLAAAAVARGVCLDGRPNEVALAIPRGANPLPLFLAVYFALGRATSKLPLKGSVSVSTRDQELRQILNAVRVAGTGGDMLPCGRLVTGRPDPNGRASAKLGELLGTKRLKGLSQDDRLILLQSPHYRPELALRVISMSVIDAASMSQSAWPLSFEWNRAAKRAQVWIGELGDRRFEEFCAACEIPLWRFDWSTIKWAVARYGVGATKLSTRELCDRALDLPALRLRACPDEPVDEELAVLEQAFASIYRRTKGEDVPSVVARARRLYYLLSRLVAPLNVYEPIAAGSRALEPNVVLRQVRDAPPGFFEGAKWKTVYETDWPSVRAGLTALYERVRNEYPKYWDVLARIDEARTAGEKLVIRCTTRAEAQALAAALVAVGWLDPEELGEQRLADISWFGTASPALRTGSGRERLTTLITEPPSPFAGAAYLSAELGCVEAILYPTQIARFERLARDRWHTSAGSANNAVVAAFSDEEPICDDTPEPEPIFERLEPFTLAGRGTAKKRAETKEIVTMDTFFAQLAALDDDEDAPVWPAGAGAADALVPRPARLLRTKEGFCVFLPEDEEVPVLIGADSRTLLRPVSELRAGQRVVLMPGADRASMLAELFERFDQRLGPAYPLLYARAFVAAYANAGGTDYALASRVGVDEGTVASWRRGEHRPQQDEVLFELLKLSEIEPAWTNRRKIRLYLGKVRGAHRAIAKVFDEAVAETIVELDGPHVKRLEQYGLDLDEFFSSVQVLTVVSVSQHNQDAPASAIGHFLASDHPAAREAV
jgi:hypothetical protein